MNLRSPLLALALLAAFLPALSHAQTPAASGNPYHVERIFHPGGDGGWDYLAVDPANHLLFIPRVTHTQVLDAKVGRLVADIPGQKLTMHGVAIAPDANRGFISDGGDAAVVIFDLKTYQVLGKDQRRR